MANYITLTTGNLKTATLWLEYTNKINCPFEMECKGRQESYMITLPCEELNNLVCGLSDEKYSEFKEMLLVAMTQIILKEI